MKRFKRELAGDFGIIAANSKRDYIYVWDGKNWNDDPKTAKWYKTYPAMKKAFKAAGYPAGSVSVAAGTFEECVRLWDGAKPIPEPAPRTPEGFGMTFYRKNPHITARKRLPYRSSTFRGGMTDYDTFSRDANENEIAELKAKGYKITKHRSALIQAAKADKQHFVFGKIANPEGDLSIGDLLIGDAQRYYGHHVPWKLDERDLKIINRLRRAHPKLLSGTPSDTTHLNVLIDKKLWENARKPRTNPSPEYDDLMHRVDEAKQKGYNASAYVNLERRTWISENEPRAQASRFLHNMIKALNIHSWQNTAEEWQRMYDAQYTLALRGRRSRSTLSTKNRMRINPGLPTTGKYSRKKYKCMTCGHISDHGTNHYGEIYPRCRSCGWKHPMEMGQTHKCLEKPPAGMGIPEPWKTVKLGDICTINPGSKPDIHVMADGIVIHNLPSTVNAGDVSYYINYDTLEHKAFKNVDDARVTPTGSGSTIGMMFTNEVKRYLKQGKNAAMVAAYRTIATKVVRELIAQSKTKRGIPVLKRSNPGRGWTVWADKNGSRFVLEHEGHSNTYRFTTQSNSAISHSTRAGAVKFAKMLQAGTISGMTHYKFVFINQSFTLPAKEALKHLMVRSPGTRDKQGTFYLVR